MPRTGAPRPAAAILLALVALPPLLLTACSHATPSSAPTTSSTDSTTTVAPTTSTTGFTTLTSAPNISIPAPSCRLSIEGSTAVGATVTVVLTSLLPNSSVDVDFRFAGSDHHFTMRTDGSGIASHAVSVPKQAAGSEASMLATMVVTHATCSTAFFVP